MMQELFEAIYKKRRIVGDVLRYCPLFMYGEFFAIFSLRERA